MTRSLPSGPGHEISPTLPAGSRAHYEWRTITVSRDASRSEARAMLTEQAEYGRWELARTQIFIGGARRVSLRRKVMRVERSDGM